MYQEQITQPRFWTSSFRSIKENWILFLLLEDWYKKLVTRGKKERGEKVREKARKGKEEGRGSGRGEKHTSNSVCPSLGVCVTWKKPTFFLKHPYKQVINQESQDVWGNCLNCKRNIGRHKTKQWFLLSNFQSMKAKCIAPKQNIWWVRKMPLELEI